MPDASTLTRASRRKALVKYGRRIDLDHEVGIACAATGISVIGLTGSTPARAAAQATPNSERR
jgi:hypothetical protein